MALDFPTSPTNGQVFNSYVYDSTISAWRSKGGATAATYVSATAPSGPVQGDMWFNSNDGTTYVWFNDGDTAQWVELRSQIATSQAGLVPMIPTSIATSSGTASVDTSGTVTFSSSSGISMNGVFTSAYRNYRVMFTPNTSSTTVTIYMRMRAAGSDLSSATYNFASSAMRDSNASFGLSGSSISAFWLNYYNGPGSGQGTGASTVDILNPKNTYTTAMWTSRGSDGTSAFYLTGSGTLYSGNYDGVTFLPNTGTFSGVLKIYGYN